MVLIEEKKPTARREYSKIVRKELLKRHLRKELSEPVLLTGQAFGFSKDEISEMMEKCYADLVRVYYN